MFESSKNDLARKVLFGERIKTIFFLSMINEFSLSILLIKEFQKIDQFTIKRGVVKIISSGSGAEWQKCFSPSFMLDSNKDEWLKIEDVYSISLSEIQDPRKFLNHEMSLNRVQHFSQVYSGETGRRKTNIEVENDNDSKYYKLLSLIK